MNSFEYWDRGIFHAIYEIPFPVFLSQFITHLSTMGGIWLAAGLGMIVCGDRDIRRWGGVLLLAIVVEWGLVDGLLKPLFARPRPFVSLDVIARDGWTQLSSFSFPSGHAGVSFVSAVILGRAFSRQRLWFYLLASCIALSRVHLGVHYPSDVLVGACVGLCVGVIVLRVVPTQPVKVGRGEGG